MFPSNLTDEATSTTSFPIKNCLGLLVCLFLWITIDLNLSGLTIILFSENHLIAFDSAISVSSSNVTDFANDDNILSSAKLYTDAFWMQKKKSFKNALNNIGPTIEPCDTPEIMSLKSLQTLLTQTVFQTRPSGTGFTLRLHVEIKFCPSRAGQFSIRLGWNSVAFCLGSRQCYKLFINYILQLQAKSFILTMQNPSFVLPGFHFAGTKLSHVITSARLNEMKKLINKSAWKNPWKCISTDRTYYNCIFTMHMNSIHEKKEFIFIIFHQFMNLWVFVNWHAYKEKLKANVYKFKQIPGGKLSCLAKM